MEDAALRKHLTFLRDQAIKQATKSQLTITAIMLSYPNYLYDKNVDLDKYRSFFLSLVSPLWTEYSGRNEKVGQATALYICELFQDIQGSLNRDELAAVYQDLDRTSGLTIAVADDGSSTLNLQVQTMFYDLASDCIPGGCEGAAGGSQISNDAVKQIITRELKGRWTPEEVVSFVTQLESVKNRLDPDRMSSGQPLKLVAGDCRSQVILTQEHPKRVYTAAYGKTLEILREMVSRLAEHCRDLVVIFCGGSYQSPWLSRVVSEYMNDMEAKAAL